jgi:3-mercaptopyruvate sulfurtransferase SseA
VPDTNDAAFAAGNAATLRTMGFLGAVALDGGMKAWREAGHTIASGKQ